MRTWTWERMEYGEWHLVTDDLDVILTTTDDNPAARQFIVDALNAAERRAASIHNYVSADMTSDPDEEPPHLAPACGWSLGTTGT